MHQLRGRVGRSTKEGYCYLITNNSNNEKTNNRLKIFSNTTNGFEISEADLEIRGPGELLGTKQAGAPSFKVGDLVKDYDVLKKARKQVYELFL